MLHNAAGTDVQTCSQWNMKWSDQNCPWTLAMHPLTLLACDDALSGDSAACMHATNIVQALGLKGMRVLCSQMIS